LLGVKLNNFNPYSFENYSFFSTISVSLYYASLSVKLVGNVEQKFHIVVTLTHNKSEA
jgi:hypothetical protein